MTKPFRAEEFSCDDALLYNAPAHFCKIFKEFLKNNIPCNFHTPNGLHCCFITGEVARLMKKANFVHPRLGLETIEPQLQKESGGKVATKEFIESVNLLKEAGYTSSDIEVNVLLGLVKQKFDDALRTIDFLEDFGVRIHLEEYSPVPYSEDFAKTKLRLDDDPLHHNNTAFVLRHPEFGKWLQMIKDRVRKINSSLN